MSTKKILFYTDAPYAGGATNQLYTLVKFLDKKKFKPVLVCDNYRNLDQWVQQFLHINVPVDRLQIKNPRDPNHYPELKAVIKKEKPDLLHLHLSHSGSCRFALLAGWLTHVPMVITEHDPFLLTLLKHWFKDFTLKRVKKIIAISEANANFLKKHYFLPEDKISIVHNGIDLEKWTTIKKDKHPEIVIGAAAELHPRKGLEHLIKATEKILKHTRNIKVIIAGKGEDRERLLSLRRDLKLQKFVLLPGEVSSTKELLKITDIFVVPSEREAFGLVAIEAMASKTPVIVSKVGGLEEIVEDGKSGLFFKPKSHTNLAAQILKLINDKKLRETLAEGGYKRVKENFIAEKMAKETEKVYEGVLKNVD